MPDKSLGLIPIPERGRKKVPGTFECLEEPEVWPISYVEDRKQSNPSIARTVIGEPASAVLVKRSAATSGG